MDSLRSYWRAVRPAVLSNFLYHFSRSVGSTLRVTAIGFPEQMENCIFCGWHGKSIVFANYFSGRGFWVIISPSKDGDMQTTIFRRLGYNVIRGSTGRQGVRATLEAIKVLKAGGTLAITPDGPRGPSGEVQGGVMLMAKKAGSKLIPVGVSARPRVLVNSWDRHLVPVPFARAALVAGEPIEIPPGCSEDQLESLRIKLKQAIDVLELEADRRMGLDSVLQKA